MQDLSRVHESCIDLARAISEMLEQRRQQKQQADIEQAIWRLTGKAKTFSYTQFRNDVYRTFPEVLRGEIKSPPPKSTIMEIADYLECSVEERNRLLRAAGYAPLPPYLEGDALAAILEAAEEILRDVQLPAYVITRDWTIHLVNEALLRLLGISEARFQAIPPTSRNIIDMIFDPDQPVRVALDPPQHPLEWQRTAIRNVFGFKYANRFCERESWYRRQVEHWSRWPDFVALWEGVDPDRAPEAEESPQRFPLYTTWMQSPVGPVCVRALFSSIGDDEFPQIVSYLPCGPADRARYAELDIAVEPRWRIYQ